MTTSRNHTGNQADRPARRNQTSTPYRRTPNATSVGWSPFHVAAIDYYNAGFLPFPLPLARKYPPPTGVPNKIAINKARLTEWLANPAPRNIGTIVPDGFLVIDVDGIAGEETLKELENKYGRLRRSWMTFRGDPHRYHLWYRTTEGLHWPGKLGAGIDLIHRHYRYVVLPPSVHPDGSQYRWINP